jgi:glyoxylase-like metal-dependent hydrolase (beta-lactamase superfamily II)
MAPLSRRCFLDHTLCTAAVATVAGLPLGLLAGPAPARSSAATLSSTALTPSLRVIAASGCNVVALGSGNDVLLIDGGTEKEAPAVLERVLRDSGARHARVLINTHWHPEQTGLNQRLGNAGATLIAHENTKLWLSRPIRTSWLPQTFGPLPPPARPTKTTYTTATLDFGAETLEYGYLQQAHTDGDLYAYFREANVLAGGGVVSSDRWPLLDWETGGWIGGLVAGYDSLLRIANDSTQIVPANGPILARPALVAHREMYFTIYERLVACLNKGMGPNEAVATQPAREFAPAWGNPDRFVASAFRSLWGHFAADA